MQRTNQVQQASSGTELHQAHTQNDLLRLLVENVAEYPIVLLDPDGRVLNWNPAAERLKGYATLNGNSHTEAAKTPPLRPCPAITPPPGHTAIHARD